RARSERLTGYLEALVDARLRGTLQVLTPRDPAQRGCQLSLRVLEGRGLTGRDAGRALFEHLGSQGIVGDWREPDVIRISPVPLYNTHVDVLRFATAVERWRSA